MDTTLSATPIKPLPARADCAPVPEFRRLKYVYGQLLGVADFQAEQSYFREKMRLHNRCLHGYGVVCGLLVEPTNEPPDCAPAPAAASAEPAPSRIAVDCGLALDSDGNELVVRRPIILDLQRCLAADELRALRPDGDTVYVSLCYCEQPVDPIRPVLADQCGAVGDCVYGKLRESVRVLVSLTRPAEDERCDACCTARADPCLLLARIDGYQRGKPITAAMIHNEVRRRLDPPYHPVVITGVNWFHGIDYVRSQAELLFGTNYDASKPGSGIGLEIEFSRPVRVDSLKPGVIDLWRVEGGKGRAGDVSQIYGDFVDLPTSATVQKIRYRQTDQEALNYGDRILIVVHCEFILDQCCRPVDGANVGGRTAPQADAVDPGTPRRNETACTTPPWGYGPWTSGNGSPGSTFQSWITIVEEKKTPAAPGGPTP